MINKKLFATFATSLRATSLAEALDKHDIAAEVVRPKWTNKRLPPPRVEVYIREKDEARALEVLTKWTNNEV